MGGYSNLKVIGGRLRATGVYLGGLTATQVAALPLPLVPGTSWYNTTTNTYEVVNSSGAISPVASGGFTEGSVLFADSSGDISQDNAEFFWDDTNHRLGIGINGPDGTLHVHTATAGVVAAVSGADDFIVENNADAGISILGPNNAFQSLAFGSPADAVGAKIRWTHDEGTLEIGSERPGGEVAFFSGNFVETARFDSAGNFGIGTGGPTAKLDVVGDVNTSTDYNIGGTQVLALTTLGSGVVNSSLTNLGTLTGLIMSGSSLLQFVQGGKIKFTGGSGNNFIEGNISNTGRLGFSTENTERITILLGGQVGIGTTLPSAKLAVNGGLHVGGNSDPGDNNLLVDGNTEIVGQLRAAAGSATTPSHAFNLDLDSGMYSIGVNILGFATGGTERIRIASNGNVGIGEPTPLTTLHLNDTSLSILRLSTGGTGNTGGMQLAMGTTADIRGLGGNDMVLYTNNIERMRITAGGNVGVGATPASTAILDTSSTTKGFRPPRWTGAQETTNTGGFGAGDAGVMWYNTTVNQFKGWDGSAIVVLG